ncbi:MAG TPA: winged helix-turn-helix domain-containing protein [Acidobacteriaceae bacterium]|nr:winged helix-turn-helix domain-containing protein [Acidobacteriaceae bacterium]
METATPSKPGPATRTTEFRFGPFVLNTASGELRKSGVSLRLQGQPLRVLSILVERAGEVVNREELRLGVWGDGTVVDFDHGLDVAINKVREILGDTVSDPRYVETLARRGYRFIGSIEPVVAGLPTAIGPTTHTEAIHNVVRGGGRLPLAAGWIVAVAALAGLAVVTLRQPQLKPAHIREITDSGRVFPGLPLQESLGQTATDGTRLFFSQIQNGRTVLSVASVGDGETTTLPFPVSGASPVLENISPDGERLLIKNQMARETEGPIWIISAIGGRAQQVGDILAHDASWMPDGKRILYANGDEMFTANEDGSDIRHFATVPGRAFWMRWSTDSTRLRFTLLRPLDHRTALWEINADGSHAHAMNFRQNPNVTECCGNWTADGRYFVFQATHDGQTDIWATREGPFRGRWLPYMPFAVTDGPLAYRSPVPIPQSDSIIFLGLNQHSELLRFDASTNSFQPSTRLQTAQYVRYTRDAAWVAWLDAHGVLWRSRADGTQQLQLSPTGMDVYMFDWSPDGQRLVLMAREPGKLWRIYTVAADSANLTPLLPGEDHNEADPSWVSGAGDIVFGRPPDVMAERAQPKMIYQWHAATRRIEPIPGSEGLFSPRSSPDGRFIAALPLGQRSLTVFDRQTQRWRTLANIPAADPVWSADSQWIYFHDFASNTQAIYRANALDGRTEIVAFVGDMHSMEFADFRFAGLAPGDVPLLRARLTVGNLFRADIENR